MVVKRVLCVIGCMGNPFIMPYMDTIRWGWFIVEPQESHDRPLSLALLHCVLWISCDIITFTSHSHASSSSKFYRAATALCITKLLSKVQLCLPEQGYQLKSSFYSTKSN